MQGTALVAAAQVVSTGRLRWRARRTRRWNAPEICSLGRSLYPPLPHRRSLCGRAAAWSGGGRGYFRQAQSARRHRGAVRAGAAERLRRRAASGASVQPVPWRTARTGGQDRGTSGAGIRFRPRRVDPRGRGPRRASFSRSNRRLSRAGLATLRSFAAARACIVLKVRTARHLGQSAPRIFRRCPPGDRLVLNRLVLGPLVLAPDGNQPMRRVRTDLVVDIGEFTDAIDRLPDPGTPEQQQALQYLGR